MGRRLKNPEPVPDTGFMQSVLHFPGETMWVQFLLGAVLLVAVQAALRAWVGGLRQREALLRREIDARQAAEAEREEIEGRLQHAMKLEALGRLTGGIAHDFNNLLAVVLGHVELAAQHVTDPLVREDLETAQRAAERGADLTRQLLSFARRAELNAATVDLGRKVTEVERFLEPALGSRVSLHIVVEDALWPVEVDVARLENVLLNLSQNARDAMPEGGNVTIRVANVTMPEGSPPAISAGDAPEPGEYVLLSVRDTGLGIPTETVNLVLDPFFSTKAPGKGTGLGLSMAYGFAGQSGGCLNIETDPDHGTTVRLYLPRATAPEPVTADESDVPLGHGELILVVEDDPGVRDIAVRYLEFVGYRTVQAGSVAQARYVLAEGHTIDLVLSDVVLPGESGIQFRQALSTRRPGLPVVLMSGHGDPRGEREVPADLDIFPKPFTRTELATRVAAELALSRDRPSPDSPPDVAPAQARDGSTSG